METAMVKLQEQLRVVVAQNEELRMTKVQEERKNQKQRSFSEKYSKDLVATKRRVAELEAHSQQLDRQNKTLQRERDVAVSQLAQLSSSSTQKLAHTQEVLALRQREVDDLSIRVKLAEDKGTQLESEKQHLVQHMTNDLENLRQAHARALENLLRYQEENDSLRAVIAGQATVPYPPPHPSPPTPAQMLPGINVQAIQKRLQHSHPLASQRALSMDGSELSDSY
jgi:chromosome segregation ATPase